MHAVSLSKGDTIYVEGSNRTNKYTDKQGVERYSTEVRGSDTQFVKTKGRENGSTGATRPAQTARQPEENRLKPGERDDFDDDIPF